MAKESFRASRAEGSLGIGEDDARAAEQAPWALEIVAVSGAEVLGVRHVLDGGVCWVGQHPESVARIPMGDYGGRPALLAEVEDGRFYLHVPPNARGRMHGADGIGRLSMGPTSLEIGEGDRAVLLMGPVQIRARLVVVTASGGPEVRIPSEARRWLAVMAALYVMALALCAIVSPTRILRLREGGIRRAAAEVMERALDAGRAHVPGASRVSPL